MSLWLTSLHFGLGGGPKKADTTSRWIATPFLSWPWWSAVMKYPDFVWCPRVIKSPPDLLCDLMRPQLLTCRPGTWSVVSGSIMGSHCSPLSSSGSVGEANSTWKSPIWLPSRQLRATVGLETPSLLAAATIDGYATTWDVLTFLHNTRRETARPAFPLKLFL